MVCENESPQTAKAIIIFHGVEREVEGMLYS